MKPLLVEIDWAERRVITDALQGHDGSPSDRAIAAGLLQQLVALGPAPAPVAAPRSSRRRRRPHHADGWGELAGER